MAARPPKISAWSASLVPDSPDVFAVNPDIPTAWQLWCGTLGYWLPHALNRSAATRRAMRSLR